MALTDTDRVKRSLRIPAGITVHDARIGEIVAEVESDMLQSIDLTDWASTTPYTDRIDIDPGSLGRSFLLRRMPVTSMVALTIGGVRLTEGTDYYVARGGVVKLIPTGAVVDPSRQDIVATYTAGHIVAGSTPAWLARWATLQAAWQYNQEPMSGVAQRDVEPVRTTMARYGFDEDACQREVERIRSRWRKPAG